MCEVVWTEERLRDVFAAFCCCCCGLKRGGELRVCVTVDVTVTAQARRADGSALREKQSVPERETASDQL